MSSQLHWPKVEASQRRYDGCPGQTRTGGVDGSIVLRCWAVMARSVSGWLSLWMAIKFSEDDGNKPHLWHLTAENYTNPRGMTTLGAAPTQAKSDSTRWILCRWMIRNQTRIVLVRMVAVVLSGLHHLTLWRSSQRALDSHPGAVLQEILQRWV